MCQTVREKEKKSFRRYFFVEILNTKVFTKLTNESIFVTSRCVYTLHRYENQVMGPATSVP